MLKSTVAGITRKEDTNQFSVKITCRIGILLKKVNLGDVENLVRFNFILYRMVLLSNESTLKSLRQ